jgi:FkbM family methyltransferase
MYVVIENLLPPIIFKILKKSFFYSFIRDRLRRIKASEQSQIGIILSGSLIGKKLRLDTNGLWQQAMINDTYDQELFEAIKFLSLENGVVYDVGAHIGYHALKFSASVGANGHVYAFEPNPVNYHRLCENIELNDDLTKKITPLSYALANSRQTTIFLGSAEIENGTSSGGFVESASTLWPKSDYVEKTGFTAMEVTQETIDNLVCSEIISPPTLMKIDVEGAEALVLQGASATIQKFYPLIIIECHSISATYETMLFLQQNAYTTRLLKQESDGRVLIMAAHKQIDTQKN